MAKSYPWDAGGGSKSKAKYPWAGSAPAGPKKRGLFGSIAHTVGKAGSNIVQDVEQIPGGVVQLGKARVKDIKTANKELQHGKFGRAALDTFISGPETTKILKGTGKATATSLRHPLRRPGDTILNTLALFSLGAGSVARVGAAGRAIEEGGGLRAAGGALVHRPRPGTFEVAPGVNKPLSRNALYREGVQKPILKKTARAIHEGREPGRAANKLGLSPQSIVGRNLRARRRIEAAIANAPVGEIGYGLKGLTKNDHAALAVIGIEGRTALDHPQAVIARHTAVHQANIAKLTQEISDLPRWSTGRAKKPSLERELKSAVEENHAQLKQLGQAHEALQNPSDRLLNAAKTLAEQSHHAEQEAIRRGLGTHAQFEARKLKIAEQYGGVPTEGSFYFPMSKYYTQHFRRMFSTKGYAPALQETGIPKPTPGTYLKGYGKEYTGKSVLYGGPGPRVAHTIMDVIARRNRLFNAQDFADSLGSLSTAEKISHDQIPIRQATGVSNELKKVLAEAENQAILGPAEHGTEWEKTEWEKIKEALSPSRVRHAKQLKAPGEVPLGTKIKGIRWVDRRYIKDLAPTGPQSDLMKAVNAINRPLRFGTVYARPAYILNKPQNWAMLAVTEGPRMVKFLAQAKKVEATYAPEELSRLDAMAGTTRSESYVAPRSVVGGTTRSIERFWQRITDTMERRAAVFGEAYRHGYDTPEKVKEMLVSNDPKIAQDRIAISQRARKNIVDFDSMTPAEQKLAAIIYFYPWMTRGSAWAVHAAVEHPLKAAGLVALSHNANNQGLPSWLGDAIPIHMHGKTYLVNPQSVNTPETATQLAQAAAGTARGIVGLPAGKNNLAQLASPALSILGAGMGQESVSRSTPGGLAGQVQGLAPVSALRRAGLLKWAGTEGKLPKTYPYPSWDQALGPLFLGGLYPRRANLAQGKTGPKTKKYPWDR